MKVSEAAAAAAQAELSTLETMMKYASIGAPISGVVTERFVDPGDLIQTAAASRTQSAPIVSVARVDRVRVVVDVPEVAAAQVRVGTPASVRIEGLSGEPISARVTRVARVLHPASRTMRTEIDLPNRSDLLRPGASAKVSLTVRSFRGALTVPVAALRTEGPERVIYRVEGRVARRVVVETGLQSPEWIQVAEGLSGNEEVAVRSSGALKDGALVRSGK
ncbi:MAG: efflux RND transporter periplasmic adaptor subunit [Acidobacteria bacterium]|nr:efflux RND transporter periplasmic adaptor subunit [Acidobacteriota bacterium]